jgi:hypothetical protein
MNRLRGRLGTTWQALLAVVVLGLLPVAADAANMGFKNDTNQPMYLQGYSVVNGRILRGPIWTIPPGKTVVDVNLPAGARFIKITDAANRVLFNEPVAFEGNVDVLYSIQPLVQSKTPRVNLLKVMGP